MPVSKSFSMRPEPRMTATSSPVLPSNALPSIRPLKSMVTRSPSRLSRSTSVNDGRCSRRFCTIASMSAWLTSATGRSTSRPSTLSSSISGITSNTARYLRSAPGALEIGSMRGPAAGVSFASVTARAKLCCTRSLRTSWRTCAPNCWRITLIGALPGRKPLSFAVRLTFCSRSATACSICSFGTLTSIRRSSAPVDSTETCIVVDPQGLRAGSVPGK